MRLQIVGFEINSGVSQKTGKPYDMSKIHTLIPLAVSEKTQGFVGTSYDCPADLLTPLQSLPITLDSPLVCDVIMSDVQQYGRRVQKITSVTPVLKK